MSSISICSLACVCCVCLLLRSPALLVGCLITVHTKATESKTRGEPHSDFNLHLFNFPTEVVSALISCWGGRGSWQRLGYVNYSGNAAPMWPSSALWLLGPSSESCSSLVSLRVFLATIRICLMTSNCFLLACPHCQELET